MHRDPDTEYVRKGGYVVPKDDFERAKAVFEDRSPRSQAIDKAFRGPITSDIEKYENSGGRIFDYPGVDTPSDSPQRAVEDMPFIGERAAIAQGRDPNGMRILDDSGNDTSSLDDLRSQGRSFIDALSPRR